MPESRVLVIGIDGGTWTILKPAIEEGHVPFLAGLIETGASGILNSTVPAITPAAWGSFQTGTNPGKTGVFDFAVWNRREKERSFVSSHALRRTIWEAASDAGLGVGVLNLPLTYPPRPVNGFVVSGMLTPSLSSTFTYPAELKADLLRAVPDYEILNIRKVKEAGSRDVDSFLAQMAGLIRARSQAASYLIGRASLHLAMVQYQASDAVQHALWHHLDREHPLHDGSTRTLILEQFYRTLDRGIRSVSDAFGGSCRGPWLTLVVSDHGFEGHRKQFNLGNWLAREGYLDVDAGSYKQPVSRRLLRKLDVLNLRRRVSWQTQSEVAGKLDRLEGRRRVLWSTSRAFSTGSANEGFIYLLEEDARQRERTADALVAQLSSIRDSETGSPIARAVHRKEDLYWGPNLDLLPDLVLIPAGGLSFNGGYVPNGGLFHTVSPDTDFHMGKHERAGIIIASGHGIRPQSDLTAEIIDMAPTILHYLGAPIWEDMDGRVLEDLFEVEYRDRHPVSEPTAAKPQVAGSSNGVFSAGEQKELERRLQGLGYW